MKNILIIGESEMRVFSSYLGLTTVDCDVSIALNADEARERIKITRPNLIVVLMPEIKGFDLRKFLREQDWHCRSKVLLIWEDLCDMEKEPELRLRADASMLNPDMPGILQLTYSLIGSRSRLMRHARFFGEA